MNYNHNQSNPRLRIQRFAVLQSVLFAAYVGLVTFAGCDYGPSSSRPDDPWIFHSLENAVRHADIAEDLRIFNSGSEVLPDSLLMLPKLRNLEWSSGRLRIIPPFIAELNSLKALAVSFCPLDTLPAEIGQMKILSGLSVEWCELRALPDEICDLSTLVHLWVRNNHISRLPDGIHKLTHLRSLNIAGNPIDSTEIERIRRALPNLETFKY